MGVFENIGKKLQKVAVFVFVFGILFSTVKGVLLMTGYYIGLSGDEVISYYVSENPEYEAALADISEAPYMAVINSEYEEGDRQIETEPGLVLVSNPAYREAVWELEALPYTLTVNDKFDPEAGVDEENQPYTVAVDGNYLSSVSKLRVPEFLVALESDTDAEALLADATPYLALPNTDFQNKIRNGVRVSGTKVSPYLLEVNEEYSEDPEEALALSPYHLVPNPEYAEALAAIGEMPYFISSRFEDAYDASKPLSNDNMPYRLQNNKEYSEAVRAITVSPYLVVDEDGGPTHYRVVSNADYTAKVNEITLSTKAYILEYTGDEAEPFRVVPNPEYEAKVAAIEAKPYMVVSEYTAASEQKNRNTAYVLVDNPAYLEQAEAVTAQPYRVTAVPGGEVPYRLEENPAYRAQMDAVTEVPYNVISNAPYVLRLNSAYDEALADAGIPAFAIVSRQNEDTGAALKQPIYLAAFDGTDETDEPPFFAVRDAFGDLAVAYNPLCIEEENTEVEAAPYTVTSNTPYRVLQNPAFAEAVRAIEEPAYKVVVNNESGDYGRHLTDVFGLCPITLVDGKYVLNLFGLFPMVAEPGYQFVLVGFSVVLVGAFLSWLAYMILAALGKMTQRTEDTIDPSKE